MLGQKCGYTVQNASCFRAFVRFEFDSIIPVQVNDRPFHGFDFIEIVAFNERLCRLRHASDQHVRGVLPHQMFVYRVPQRSEGHERFSKEVYRRDVSLSPQEFFKVQRMHLYAHLFRWDEDSFYVLFKRYERTCLNVAVTSILDKVLDELSGGWECLYLIEYDDALSFFQRCAVSELKLAEQGVKVV